MTKLMTKQRKQNALVEGIFSNILKEETWAQGAPNNTIVTAEVKAINFEAKQVVVYTGFKSDSVIPFHEFKINGEDKIPTIGDHITVIVKGIDPKGCVIVSFKEVKTKQRMEEVEKLFIQKETIEGTILNKIKSGYYKNNSFAVDLGFGIVGLITLDSYGETHPGDKLMCRIVSFSTKKLGIILARENSGETGSSNEKNYQQNTETFTEGEQHTIRITEIKDFGIIGEKIHNSSNRDNKYNNSIFVHGSELFFNKRSRTATEIERSYHIGDEVQVVSLRLDPIKNRPVYSIRSLLENLFLEFQNYLKKEKIIHITGSIIEKRNDSFIVGIPFPYTNKNNEITTQIFEGRLYTKDLTWNEKEIHNLQRTLDVGSSVTCKILDFHPLMNQISEGYGFIPLSIKHMTTDPFRWALENIQLGQIYPCQFLEYNDNYHGFLVNLIINNTNTDENITVIVRHKDLGTMNQVKSGNKSHCKIIRIEEQDRLFFGSIKAAESDNKDILLKEYESNNRQGTTTLGNILDIKNK